MMFIISLQVFVDLLEGMQMEWQSYEHSEMDWDTCIPMDWTK